MFSDFRNLKVSGCEDAKENSIVSHRGAKNDGRGGNLARRRYQTGTLRLRGKRKKVWTLRWREDLVDADGSVRRVKREAVVGTHAELPTQKLARRRADLFLSRVNRPDYRPGKVIGFEEFAERWKEHSLSQQKPSSQAVAESHLKTHLVPTFGRLRLDQMGQEDVQAFVTVLGKKLGQHTVLNILGTLFAILKTARKWGYVVNEIRAGDLAISSDKPSLAGRFFTAEQAMQIVERAVNPWRTIFAVAAFTGMRPGEVLGLSVDDLDFTTKQIFVRRSAWYSELLTTKTKASAAAVPMPQRLETYLKEFLATFKPSTLLFSTRRGNPHSRNKVVEKHLWPILDALGIPRCGMHAFRHGCASAMLQMGASPKIVQEQLRHADPMTTMRMYVHTQSEDQKEAANKFAEVLAASGRKLESNAKYLN
jgi:integrase